jgi:drug/metabolite transporter (DMT)-like permease
MTGGDGSHWPVIPTGCAALLQPEKGKQRGHPQQAGVLAATQLGQPLVIPATDLMWCVLMGIVTMSGGMILYTPGSRVVPSAELTLLSNTEVLLAPFWVWLIMGETASTATFIGGAVVLVAIVFNAYAGVRRMAHA